MSAGPGGVRASGRALTWEHASDHSLPSCCWPRARPAGRLGTLEPGRLADLAILRGNPLEDIRSTRNVHIVFRNGVRHDARALLESVKGQLGPRGPEELAEW